MRAHILFLFAGFTLLATHLAEASSASGTNGAVATIHPLASQAALDVMKRGGNAVDATVMAALVLGVVDSHNSGIGGGCFLLLQTPDGKRMALDGREMAPRRATAKMFYRNGAVDPDLSQTGPLASGIPGSLAVYHHVLKKYGRFPLATHLRSAAQLARNGFSIDPHFANRLLATSNELARFQATRDIFLQPDGRPWPAGSVLKQPDLARSYESIADQGIDWFYGGDFARKTEAWMKKNGGVSDRKDFQNYRLRLREPLVTTFRGFEIIGFPPPSSGGVHVAQILNLVEELDLPTPIPTYPESVHLVAEAMKLAFADRAFWLGDPDFARVPRGLVSKPYAAALRRNINPLQASVVEGSGDPPKSTSDLFPRHTTHFSAADRSGFWVACTATLNTSFGSKVVIPGTGILLNNQMDDFSIEPGKPNYFGLVGSEANAVAGGKRPLSSMSPTLVCRDGKPFLSLGAAGGPTIISQTVLNLLNVLLGNDSLEAALRRPRFHHQWKPDELKIESSVNLKAQLEKRGHRVRQVESLAASQAVGWEGGTFTAVGEPRSRGMGAAW